MGKWQRFREAFWNPNAGPIIFFAAAYLIGISVNLTSGLIEETWGEDKSSAVYLALAFGIPGLVALVLLIPRILRWRTGEAFESFAEVRSPRPHKGLIAIASLGKGIETAERAIRYHAPALEKAWLLCSSTGDQMSEPLARELKLRFERTLRFRPDVIEIIPLPLSKFEDPESVKDAIEKIYASLPEHLFENDIVIDITGGRKTTTAGAFLAGLPKQRHLEVILARERDELGRPKLDDPIQIDISFSLKRVR